MMSLPLWKAKRWHVMLSRQLLPECLHLEGQNWQQLSVELKHHIFSKGEWKSKNFLDHPTLRLQISVSPSDYTAFRRPCPTTKPLCISCIADTGAQSCLWSMSGFLAAGFMLTSREEYRLILKGYKSRTGLRSSSARFFPCSRPCAPLVLGARSLR